MNRKTKRKRMRDPDPRQLEEKLVMASKETARASKKLAHSGGLDSAQFHLNIYGDFNTQKYKNIFGCFFFRIFFIRI